MATFTETDYNVDTFRGNRDGKLVELRGVLGDLPFGKVVQVRLDTPQTKRSIKMAIRNWVGRRRGLASLRFDRGVKELDFVSEFYIALISMEAS
jgi:hypothetical protein